LGVCAALVLSGAAGAAWAENIDNGRHLSERWCAECHAISPGQGKSRRTPSFVAIAAKPGITAEMIAAFLHLPHATMPNPALSATDAQDIAAFIMDMKK